MGVPGYSHSIWFHLDMCRLARLLVGSYLGSSCLHHVIFLLQTWLHLFAPNLTWYLRAWWWTKPSIVCSSTAESAISVISSMSWSTGTVMCPYLVPRFLFCRIMHISSIILAYSDFTWAFTFVFRRRIYRIRQIFQRTPAFHSVYKMASSQALS